VTWLLALLLIAVPVGLAVWWAWPRRPPPRLIVTAFDCLTLQGEPAAVRARLEPLDPLRTDAEPAGQEVVFEEPRPGNKPVVRKAVARADGAAEVGLVAPARARLDIIVRYAQPGGPPTPPDRARVFAWPAKTRLLLVDIAALTQNGAKLWEQEKIPDAPLLPGATGALQAGGKSGFRVAYLALGPTRALRYRQVRDWVERRTAAGQAGGLPDGPVLGRVSVGVPDADAAPAVGTLLQRFAGPHVVLVREAADGEAFRQAGLKTLTVGPGGLAWDAVAKELAR
jgi:hypothetical protein